MIFIKSSIHSESEFIQNIDKVRESPGRGNYDPLTQYGAPFVFLLRIWKIDNKQNKKKS